MKLKLKAKLSVATDKELVKSQLKEIKKLIKEDKMIGVFGRPSDNITNISKVSHKVTGISIIKEKKEMFGDREILVHPEYIMVEVRAVVSPAFVNEDLICCQGDELASLITYKTSPLFAVPRIINGKVLTFDVCNNYEFISDRI